MGGVSGPWRVTEVVPVEYSRVRDSPRELGLAQ